MAFQHAAVERMRSAYETATSRLANMRKANERGIERASSVAFTSGTSLMAGYVNERWGKAPVSDPSAPKEVTILGLPADMLGGGVMLAGTLLGAFGKYDHFALSVGNGALAAFSYRFGMEFARKHEVKAPTATAGALGPPPWQQTGAEWAAGGPGRTAHFSYAGAQQPYGS